MFPRTTSLAVVRERGPAQVIPLPTREARRIRRAGDDDSATLGQILLYTGIRYERVLDVVEADAKPQRRRS